MLPVNQTVLTRDLLEQLYVKHETALYNLAYRYLGDAAEAQDLVQEVFVKLWQRRQDIRSRPENAARTETNHSGESALPASGFEPYLFRTALNMANNRRRWKKLRGYLSLSGHEPFSEPFSESCAERFSPGHLLHQSQMNLLLERSLARLPHKLKQVVILCELLEHSYAEAAAILSIPIGTVGSRRNKALAMLRQWTQGEFDGAGDRLNEDISNSANRIEKTDQNADRNTDRNTKLDGINNGCEQ